MDYNFIMQDFMVAKTGFLIALFVWMIIWKGIALWFAARRRNIVMFVFILLFNTAGVLPISYLIYLNLTDKPKKKTQKRKKGVKK
jgi:cytochrome c oxidase subunit IV